MRFDSMRCAVLVVWLGLVSSTAAQSSPANDGFEVNWPSAAGPNGSWSVKTDKHIPKKWSVTTGENIAWKTVLPEGGQSNIAVWGDRLFLTINKPLPDGTPAGKARGADIVGYCLNSKDGKTMWTVELPGQKPMEHSNLFSDNTTPTPLTNGEHVWFVNAGGLMACYTMDGKPVWTRKFETRTRHNAKQCEPLLVDNSLIYVEMREPGDPKRRPMKAKPFARNTPAEDWPWTFVRAINATTGIPQWTNDAGASIHNTPRAGQLAGKSVVCFARGGGHAPPETPYGFTMCSATGGHSLWDTPMKSAIAYCVAHFDSRNVYCFDGASLVLLDAITGKTKRSIALNKNATVRSFDSKTSTYSLVKDSPFPLQTKPAKANAKANTKARKKRTKNHPTNQANIVVGKHCLFMSYTDHSICRVNVETGTVEYLQVPYQVQYTADGERSLLWDKHIPADTLNSRGINVANDRRAKGSGWGHVTSASPIAVNNLVFFSTMLGTVYVIDANAETFDETALVSVSDLGPAGKTWSLSSLSYSNGQLFHRGLKHIVKIQ